MKSITPRDITAMKGVEKIACLTAYDYRTARLLDDAGIHLILVGDSLGMTVLGYENTLPVTMDEMIHHTAAVARGVKYALVVGDMPFMSYQASIEQALLNAGRFIRAGAHAVKVEGGAFRAETIRALVQNGIPVLGHIGLTPQSIQAYGGHKVQGRNEDAADQLREDARAVAAAGAFAMVIEGVPADLATEITGLVDIPTIGIGAGPGCDGQVLVVNDILGMFGDFKPKFVKRYAELGAEMKKAFDSYKKDVEDGKFPGPEHCY